MSEANENILKRAKLRQQRWKERQERSMITRDEIEKLKTDREELRKKLDAKEQSSEANTIDEKPYTEFTQLPISRRTQLGLERGHYKIMTPIQKESLHLVLAGYDVLGAAQTGSGKTLCFVIPILEKLLVEQWEIDTGLGAIVLSPTRELALQIFKVLQIVGYKHVFSAALLTGGRNVEEEKRRLHAINIIVGTPGRVLHHLEDGSKIVKDSFQMLVLDEADRLLDMGFRQAILNLLEYLRVERQTLLFSATQTSDVQMLAQMSLKCPRYVSSHVTSSSPMPSTLCQNFIVIEQHRKIDALLAFLRRHPNDKVVVFLSTCNQVKFMYLALSKVLKKLHIPSMCLTSKMKQFRREEVFLTFCRCKSAVLFCTDVASRGLDFPLVHWVVQFDCPDSAQTYIHRAGRTARAGARGVSLLFLTPREVPMLSYIANKNVKMREIAINPQHMRDTKEIMVALVIQGLKYDAQKAFIAYLRSVYFSANKHVFEVASIDVEKFAKSLGLPVVPDMSELQQPQRGAKNLSWAVLNFIEDKEKAKDRKNITRTEKRLTASDMFRTLQQKQKYASYDLLGDQTNNQNADGSDTADTFFIEKKSEGTDPVKTEKLLTYEERMAGLSKQKKRKFIENPDLRVKDLKLSTHVFYNDDGEEEGGEQGTGTDGDVPSKKKNSSKSGSALPSARNLNLDPIDSSSDDEEENNEDAEEVFARKLRQLIQMQDETDKDRAKSLRKVRRLQKEGKLSKKTTADDVAGNNESSGEGEKSEGDDELYDSDGVSSTGSISRLIKIAKGEGKESESDASDDNNCKYQNIFDSDNEEQPSEEDNDIKIAPPTKKRKIH